MFVLVRKAIAGKVYSDAAVVLFQFVNILLPYRGIVCQAMYEQQCFIPSAFVYISDFAIVRKVDEMRFVWVCDQFENLKMCKFENECKSTV